jgi:type I restriction enzyme R subunit
MSVQRFEPIALTNESTVVAEYQQEARSSSSYQSEAQLETAFIELLKEQAYGFLVLKSEKDLIGRP